jgi:hypothetical protein
MRATNRANLFASSARCPRKDKPPRPEESYAGFWVTR